MQRQLRQKLTLGTAKAASKWRRKGRKDSTLTVAAKELAKALPESRALAKLDLQGHSFSDSIKRELQAAQEQSRVRELLL